MIAWLASSCVRLEDKNEPNSKPIHINYRMIFKRFRAYFMFLSRSYASRSSMAKIGISFTRRSLALAA